jgi:hypothetical protein
MSKKNQTKPAVRIKSKVRAGVKPPPQGWENHNQQLVKDSAKKNGKNGKNGENGKSDAKKSALRSKTGVRAGLNGPPQGWSNHNQRLVVDR